MKRGEDKASVQSDSSDDSEKEKNEITNRCDDAYRKTQLLILILSKEKTRNC